MSVFEHISKPWKAAKNLTRLLKPGGICYHAAPFSYFYHGAPADFWRFTPDAFELMFSDLRPIKSEFYSGNRRRDNRGSDTNRVDQDGGPAFSVDALGGWRVNWFTIFVGKKDAAYLAEKTIQAETQLIINLMKHFETQGLDVTESAKKLQKLLLDIKINQDLEISIVETGRGMKYTQTAIRELWRRRGRNGIKVSYARFVMAAQLGL